MKTSGKVIALRPAPYIRDRAPGFSLLYPMLEVFYEEKIITWDEYASQVPAECRPLKYRHRPKKPEK